VPCRAVLKPARDLTQMTPAQATIEREVVATMYRTLRIAESADLDTVDVMTTFLANLVMDQQSPHQTLKRIVEGTRKKMIEFRSVYA
jgi:hypothetical protein